MNIKKINDLKSFPDFVDNIFNSSDLLSQSHINMVICIDSSGSNTTVEIEAAKLFLSNIKDVMAHYDSFNLTIWKFDNCIIDKSIESFSTSSIDEIVHYDVSSTYGDSSTLPNIQMINDLNLHPDLVIIFTDGMLDSYPERQHYLLKYFIISDIKLNVTDINAEFIQCKID